MLQHRKNDKQSRAGRVSPRARLLAGLCLALLAAGASAGLLGSLLNKVKVEVDLGQLLNVSLDNAVLNLQLLGLVELEIDGNQVLALLSLENGVEADLLLTFDEVEDLTEDSIGLSVEQLNPIDPLLLQRLPAGVQLPPQGAFPMLISIEPPAAENLSFDNTVDLELHTHNLEYTPGTRLRLFAASHGGNFRDITTYVGEGSYRCRGSRGKFSEFLVALDTRDTQTVIADKFNHLQTRLYDFRAEMSASAYWTLFLKVVSARSAWYFGDKAYAVEQLESALETIDDKSGTEIPNSWSAGGQTGNAAGELTAAIHTLIFSLQLP